MPDEATMLAAYAASYPDETDRLILADWLEERGDVRGTWLRNPDLARIMGPNLDDPRPKLIADLATDPNAAELLARLGSADLASHVEHLKSDDPRIQKAALAALAKLGEEAAPAVPAILALVREDRDEIRTAAIETLGQLGSAADAALVAASGELEYGDRTASYALHDAIVALGPRSRAVRVLVSDLGSSNGNINESAMSALGQLGPEVFDVVLREGAGIHREQERNVFIVLRGYPDADARLLAVAQDRTRDEGSRGCAIQALVDHYWEDEIDEDRDWLIPHLIELAADPSDAVLREVATALGHFGERAAEAVPALVQLLDRQDEWLRIAVVDALCVLGPTARVALPQIQALIGQVESISLDRAAQNFVRQHAEPQDLADEIRQGLQSGKAQSRIDSLSRLAEMPGHFPDLLDLIRRVLDDPDEEVCQAASGILTYLPWPPEIDTAPFLRKLLTHRRPDVRTAAIRNLENAANLVRVLLPDLLARLNKERNAEVRQTLVAVLGGPTYGYREEIAELNSPEVLQAVRARLADSNAGVRRAALETLARLWHPLPEEAIPDLLELARTDTQEAGRRAISTLVQHENRPEGLIDILRERMHGYPHRWEDETFEALNRLGYTPTLDEMPLLLQAINEQNTSFAYSAAGLLGRLGEPAIPGLIPLLEEGQPRQLRACVSTALGAIGPAARTALPALIGVLESEDEWDATSAMEAISRIGEPHEVIDALRPCFRHRNGRIRKTVVEIAQRLGGAARPWLPDLLHLSRTDGETAEVLAILVREDPALLEQILPLLEEPEPARWTARQVLRRLGIESSGERGADAP